PAANSKSIQLDVHLDTAVGLVSADPDRIQQIVWNLLSNAVKFTPAGGRVELRLEAIGSAVQIQVSDTGKGIHPDFLPYVFERFRQADATTTRSQGGLGLGLAIVRNLVELHGGEVAVQSAGEGQGSTFTVQLPRLVDPIESLPHDLFPHRQTSLETPLTLEGLKILAVDDELDSREFLKAALEQYGATVITAGSVAEALRLFQLHQPNVLLSDIGMPGEDGYHLIQTIRSLPTELGGMIPAAALTAYAREGDRLAALNAGFQMHVPKPIEPMQLVQVIAKLTGRLRDSVLN
ncbi:MAG TPA: ATP-binding protein, partial [Allocoleopsis sp.]